MLNGIFDTLVVICIAVLVLVLIFAYASIFVASKWDDESDDIERMFDFNRHYIRKNDLGEDYQPVSTIASFIAESKITPAKKSLSSLAASNLGKKGGAARKLALSPERRSEIARQGAEARWAKHRERQASANQADSAKFKRT